MNRKHIFCVILYTLFSFSSFSQNFKAVDSIALSYKSNYGSPKKLANQIKQDFKTDLDRVRAIYTWMANNISYDIQESSFPSYSYSDEEDRIQKEQEYAVRLSKRVITKKKAESFGNDHGLMLVKTIYRTRFSNYYEKRGWISERW